MCVVVEGDGGRASKPTQIKWRRQRRRRRRRVHRQYRQYRDPMRRPRRRRQSPPEASKVKRVVGEAPLERERERKALRDTSAASLNFSFSLLGDHDRIVLLRPTDQPNDQCRRRSMLSETNRQTVLCYGLIVRLCLLVREQTFTERMFVCLSVSQQQQFLGFHF